MVQAGDDVLAFQFRMIGDCFLRRRLVNRFVSN